MKRLKNWLFVIISAVILSACTTSPLPAADPTPTFTPAVVPTAAAPTPIQHGGDALPPFMPALQKFTLDRFGVKPDEFQLIKMEPVEWPDSCLGAAQVGEICAQVITPGYKLQVKIKGKTYELHSDSGQTIRMPAEVVTNPDIPPAAEAARLWMMDQLKVDSSAIRVTNVTEEDWPDGCLGVHKPEIACTSMIVPGYRVTIETGGAGYEIRTSRDGKAIVLADPAYQISNPKTPVLERPQITWKTMEPGCMLMQANGDQAAFGACGANLKITRLSNPERIKELAALILQYHPFSALTPAGEINFYGGGKGDAAPAQQRALAEWAKIVVAELTKAAPQPDAGLVLTWRREGGIAGFCDNLKVYRYGLVTTSNCKSGSETTPVSRWLTADQMSQLFTWLDKLKNVNGIQSDNAVADSMKITWALTANGTLPASESEMQAIQSFAAQVYSTKP